MTETNEVYDTAEQRHYVCLNCGLFHREGSSHICKGTPDPDLTPVQQNPLPDGFPPKNWREVMGEMHKKLAECNGVLAQERRQAEKYRELWLEGKETIRQWERIAEELTTARKDAQKQRDMVLTERDEAQAKLDNLQHAKCLKCGRSLAPDGDCYGCECDRLNARLTEQGKARMIPNIDKGMQGDPRDVKLAELQHDLDAAMAALREADLRLTKQGSELEATCSCRFKVGTSLEFVNTAGELLRCDYHQEVWDELANTRQQRGEAQAKVEQLEASIKAVTERAERAKTALRFYGNEKNYVIDYGVQHWHPTGAEHESPVVQDAGAIARKALGEGE